MGVLGGSEPEAERPWKEGALPVKEESQRVSLEMNQAGFPGIANSVGVWRWDEILGI